MAEFTTIGWRGRQVRIEYAWLEAQRQGRPPVVFLHEGLGSLSAWRDFPQRLCVAADCPGLVYSRPGYGRSTARAADEHWGPDFMHRQAYEVLPALLQALRVDGPLRLFGHSDGASIALLYAAYCAPAVSSVVVLAPHLHVEPVSITSIQAIREDFLRTELPQRLARHHDDVASAFWGWNDAWLNPAFRSWNIESQVAQIGCPLLAVQGVDDAYGTLRQVRDIQRLVPATRVLELEHCGHSPHRDQPEAVIAACLDFWR